MTGKQDFAKTAKAWLSWVPRSSPGFAVMRDDGKTSGGCWIYTGVYTEAGNTRASAGAGAASWVGPGGGASAGPAAGSIVCAPAAVTTPSNTSAAAQQGVRRRPRGR